MLSPGQSHYTLKCSITFFPLLPKCYLKKDATGKILRPQDIKTAQ